MDNPTRKRLLGTAKTVLEHSPSRLEDMQANGAYASSLALVVIASVMVELMDDVYEERRDAATER